MCNNKDSAYFISIIIQNSYIWLEEVYTCKEPLVTSIHLISIKLIINTQLFATVFLESSILIHPN